MRVLGHRIRGLQFNFPRYGRPHSVFFYELYLYLSQDQTSAQRDYVGMIWDPCSWATRLLIGHVDTAQMPLEMCWKALCGHADWEDCASGSLKEKHSTKYGLRNSLLLGL